MEIILWIIDLLIPSAFLLLGLYFTIAPVKERNKTKGYRTNLSLRDRGNMELCTAHLCCNMDDIWRMFSRFDCIM